VVLNSYCVEREVDEEAQTEFKVNFEVIQCHMNLCHHGHEKD
jgi:hypothetical protein